MRVKQNFSLGSLSKLTASNAEEKLFEIEQDDHKTDIDIKLEPSSPTVNFSFPATENDKQQLDKTDLAMLKDPLECEINSHKIFK